MNDKLCVVAEEFRGMIAKVYIELERNEAKGSNSVPLIKEELSRSGNLSKLR